ncbi:MAG: DUF294 nucleotidyltransferase-like domain-containing protein [Acidobacteriota bacterium]
MAESVATSSASLTAPVSTLVAREPVWVAPDTPVRDAARQMATLEIGSVLVQAHGDEPAGILTDRDLRTRVLAADRPTSTPVGEIASRPLLTLDADAPIVAAHVAMLDADVRHLVLLRDGAIVGLVSASDLLRHPDGGSFTLVRRLDTDLDATLPRYRSLVEDTVAALSAGGLDASHVAPLVSALNDHLVRRLLVRAIEALGEPLLAWSWIVFGSEGRREQTLLTDQDNALIYDDPSPDGSDDEVDGYFRALAERMAADLRTAGFPPCPGGYMATRWRGPRSEWTRRFAGWIETPDPDAMLAASIFFDVRPVAGPLDLTPLDTQITAAGRQSGFLHHLFETASIFRPPIGLFGRLRTDRGALDLKAGGIAPIVGMARVAGLAAGSLERGSLARLTAAVDADVLARPDRERLDDIFRFLLDLRLRHQLDQKRRDVAVTSSVRLADLSAVDRDRLKRSLGRVSRLQEALGLRW